MTLPPSDARVVRSLAGRLPGLSDLPDVPLTPGQEGLLEELRHLAGAGPVIRERLVAEARDLCALENLTRGRRLRVQGLNTAGGDLRAILEMRVPVAVMDPDGDGEVRIEPTALLLLMYPGEAIRQPIAGTRFVAVARPVGLWHPNASPQAPHGLCLGPRLPAGIRVAEVLLLAYQALAMQGISRELDVLNPAGVLQPAAARWWQSRAHRLPLSREPFLAPSDLRERLPAASGSPSATLHP